MNEKVRMYMRYFDGTMSRNTKTKVRTCLHSILAIYSIMEYTQM